MATSQIKLYWSSRSPFARKVTVAAHEVGVIDQLVLVPTVVSTMTPDPAMLEFNALGQIPVLQLPDGSLVQDSLTICEFVDALGDRPHLFPAVGPARWRALSCHALGQALMETLVKIFAERKRTGDPLHPDYLQAFLHKFRRVVASLEADAPEADGVDADIGDIAIACALAYADFRFPQEAWRTYCPRLAAWHAAFSLRPSMQATDFRVPSP